MAGQTFSIGSGSRRARRWRGSTVLAAVVAMLTLSGAAVAVVPAAALDPGVPFVATATVSPHVVLRGQTHVDFAVVVSNHEGEPIGSVRIRRPSNDFLEPAACGAAPAGWTGVVSAGGEGDTCTFESDPGDEDDIAPGTSATFHVTFSIRAANVDALAESWQVLAQTDDMFLFAPQNVTAANDGDLDTEVRTFEVTRAVIVNGAPPAANTPCPAANTTAPIGATRSIVVCGNNRGSTARMPTATGGASSLTGTMIAAPGTFSSGSISGGATNVVLTRYTNATITATAGNGKTLVAKVGTNASPGPASSVMTPLSGHSAYGAVTHLELTVPSTATAGDPVTATVDAKDAANVTNADYVGTVHFTSTDPQAVLPADLALTTADAGSHSFTGGVTFKIAGLRSLAVTDGVRSAAADVTVVPGPPSELRLETAPDGSGDVVPAQLVTAGDSITLYAVSRDEFGNYIENAAADTWALEGTTDGVADGDLVVAPDGRSAVFTGNLVGTATVRATRAGVTDGLSGLIAVVPGAPAAVAIGGFADPTTAGDTHLVTVTALDDHGNVAVDYAGTVTISSTDPAAVLPADATFTPADAGVRTFPVTLKTAGEQSITVTDTGDASRTATQGAITVVHGPAATVTLSGSTADLDVGSSRTFTATVRDAYGNVVTTGPDAAANVAFSQTAGAGSVSGTGVAPAVGGAASKSVTGVASGPVTLQASAVFDGAPSATNTNTLTFAVTTQFDFSGFLGIGGPPTVTTVRAGMIVPLIFSLDGYHGMNVFATGYPRTVQVPCTFPTSTGAGQATDALGRRDLHYIPFVDTYVYLWTTDRDWKNTCRQLVVTLADGSTYKANFRFTR